MRLINKYLIIFILVFTIQNVSAIICNPNLPGGCPSTVSTSTTSNVNYSLQNVNNSYYHQSLTPQQVANLFSPLSANLDMNSYQIDNSANQVPAIDNTYSNGWFNKAWQNVYSYIVGLKETTRYYTNYGTGYQNLSEINVNNITATGTICYNPTCTTYSYFNGTSLITKVN